MALDYTNAKDPERRLSPAAAIGTLAVVAVALGVLVYVLWPRSTWETEHRAELRHLKSQAESLASAGRSDEARDKYNELRSMLKGRTLNDPVLHGEMTRAMEDHERLVTDMALSARPASASRQTE